MGGFLLSADEDHGIEEFVAPAEFKEDYGVLIGEVDVEEELLYKLVLAVLNEIISYFLEHKRTWQLFYPVLQNILL